MKISELLNFVDTVKPNAFPASVKVAWLNEVEGMVWTDVMLLSPLEFKKYLYDENTGEGDGELLVNAPHDKLYNVYLAAMIDFYNGEYDKYQNSITMFNSYFSDYMRWYALNYRPADGGFRYMGEYITAYGIAVKHGFEGTEEEWLTSLGSGADESAIRQAVEDYLEENPIDGTAFETDDTLTLKNGILSVNTTDKVSDSTLPITSAAVNVAVGNIEVLLKTI